MQAEMACGVRRHQPARGPAKTCQASLDFATMLSTESALSLNPYDFHRPTRRYRSHMLGATVGGDHSCSPSWDEGGAREETGPTLGWMGGSKGQSAGGRMTWS